MLDDFDLRRLVNALAPLAEIDSIAGLRGRSRDPREHAGTGGEQRDAAAALDAACDRGALKASRMAHQRYVLLPLAVQATARWVAERGGAVRDGAAVSVEEWVGVYARLEAPLELRERVERERLRASVAGVQLRAAKREARRGLTPDLARKIDAARKERTEAAATARAAREDLRAWATGGLEALAREWEATA